MRHSIGASARSVDLDLDCVLFGQLETLVRTEGRSLAALLDPPALAALPRQLGLLAGVAAALVPAVLGLAISRNAAGVIGALGGLLVAAAALTRRPARPPAGSAPAAA